MSADSHLGGVGRHFGLQEQEQLGGLVDRLNGGISVV
jgi:hypothetical protein